MWSIYCLFLARINKLVDAYTRARAHISKEKMNENDENVDPMRDAAPDVEHLRLEISENGEVFYRIDDVTLMMLRRCQQLLFSCFFLPFCSLLVLALSLDFFRRGAFSIACLALVVFCWRLILWLLILF